MVRLNTAADSKHKIKHESNNMLLIRNVIKLDLILVSSKLLYLNLFKNKL